MRSSCVGAGSTSLNSWPRADTPANRPERYSLCSGVNPADLMGSGKVGFISIHVALVALVGFQFCDVGFRFLGVFAADCFDDVVQRGIHILRHAARVAADVEMRARFEPRPQLVGGLKPCEDCTNTFTKSVSPTRSARNVEATPLRSRPWLS